MTITETALLGLRATLEATALVGGLFGLWWTLRTDWDAKERQRRLMRTARRLQEADFWYRAKEYRS